MSKKLDRYLEMADKSDLPSGMLGAFAACFTWDEVADVLANVIDDADWVRRPILNRVLRLAQDTPNSRALNGLVSKLLEVAGEQVRLRRRVGSVLSALFGFLTVATQRKVIAYWQGSASVDSQDRWLKAVEQYDRHFNAEEIFRFWRDTRHWKAAKLIAYRAPPTFVQTALEEIIEHCDQGWVVSRAALRACRLSEAHLDNIRMRFPVSYVYLCAKTGRQLAEDVAIETFIKEGPETFTGSRSLVLWSIGHLGMWDTLEKICQLWPDIREKEWDHWLNVRNQERHMRTYL
jgi:hypothetical protein